MANRQRAEARRKAQAKAARQSGEGGGGGLKWMWIALGVVVLVVGVVVIVSSGGDDETSEPGSTLDDGSSLDDLPASQPVTVTGDPLPTLAVDDPAADVVVGTPAPVLSGLNFQGDEIVIDAAASGKPYMVVFLAHWCPHCNDEMPLLRRWKQSGGVPEELQVIGVATAVSESAANYPPAEWFNTKGWQWPVLVDESTGDEQAGKAAQAFGAPGWPYFVIIGADGLVKARYSGEIPVDDLQALVDSALAS